MSGVILKDFSWERMIAAVEDVRERACRAAGALKGAGIPHVIVGDHAVAAWVARVDKEAVWNTKDIDLLVRRTDFPAVVDALQSVGFVHQNIAGVDMFLDGPEGSVRSAVHIIFASEKVYSDYSAPTPEVTESETGPDFPVPTLDALVRMKLTSFRLKDKVHLMDLLDVGLIDQGWCDRLPAELGIRLEELIDQRQRACRQRPNSTCSIILIGICSAAAAWCSPSGFFRADSQCSAFGGFPRADRDLQDSWHRSSPLPGAGPAREGWWHGTQCL